MSRMTARLATVALMGLIATPVLAQSRTTNSPQSQAAGQATPTGPSSAEVRAAYDRMDALTRSVFWAEEQQNAPMDPIAGVRLSQALRELGQYDQAVQAAETTLALQPNNLEAMLEIGRGHIARGHAFYGVATLEQARDQAPNDWRSWSLLGTAYEQISRFDEAQQAWARALQLSPENPTVLANTAVALMTRGDAASAEPLLRRAAAQPAASLQVKLNLALALGLQGKMDEAEQILRRELPPQQAEQNLAWLRGRTNSPPTGAEMPRTWDSLAGS